LNRDLM